jgi:hypothetical protein
MGTWTVTTTAAEDDAITFAYDESQRAPGSALAGAPPFSPPPPGTTETVQQYFDRMAHISVVSPMLSRHQGVKNAELIGTLETIPEANRPAARTDIETVIVQHGGTVKLRECRYLWSTNTAAPPRNNSIEADVTWANIATLTKLTFYYLDADNVNRMSGMMSDTPVGTIVRIEDVANPTANFLKATTTALPIQRQGANGYVELAVKFDQSGGTLADTLPMTTTFS